MGGDGWRTFPDRVDVMSEDLAKVFTPVIAFVLPGLIGLYGLSFYLPVIRVWFGTAAEKDTTVGGFFFVLLASLATGLVLSGLRCLVLDRCMPSRPAFDYSKRGPENVERALSDIRAQHYAYYQFYANTLCALAMAFVGWQTATRPRWTIFWETVLALVGVGAVLLWSARDCIKKYDEKTAGVLGLVKSPKRRDTA